MSATRGHAVIVPTFNSGPMLARTVAAALAEWPAVWVAVDGSTDGSEEALSSFRSPGLRVLRSQSNSGKGAAVLSAAKAAIAEGITHALVLDADGQHPCNKIGDFMKMSFLQPDAMILGVPEFGPDAPPARVYGRLAGNFFADMETLWGGIGDSLFGFRLYPLGPLLEVLDGVRDAAGFGFDTQAAVRLFWAGIRPITAGVPVRYPPKNGGGVTHFRYLHDNLLLARVHAGLCFELIPRLLSVWNLRNKWRSLERD